MKEKAKSKRTRLMAWGLSALLAVGCLPSAAFADELKEEVLLGSFASEAEDLNSEDSFSAFVDRAFGLYPDIGLYNNYGETIFEQGTVERHIYDSLKQSIEEVAQKGGSTKFQVDLSQYPISGTGNSEDEAKENASDKLGSVVGKVLDALMVDLPLDLYWYKKGGKDEPVGCSYGGSMSGQQQGGQYTMTFNSFIISFVVANAYRQSGVDEPIYTVTSDVTKVTKAAENAKSYVTQYAEESDYQKLVSYKDTICELTSYNHDAADSSTHTSYGDPWQLIWVFDGDPDTKVVCEGYSKAFQYLCDLTTWENDKIACYITAGTMAGGTGAGGHMWNTVTMDDGNNYLVDITNSDKGSVGEDGGLFLAGTDGSVNEGYKFRVGNSQILYTYDDSDIALYGTDILTLANADYGKGPINYTLPSYLTKDEKIEDIPAEIFGFNGQPVEYKVLGGSLPSGLALNTSTGTISGTPDTLTDGETSVTIGVRLAGSSDAYSTIELSFPAVREGIVVSYDFPETLTVGSPIDIAPTVSGGSGQYVDFVACALKDITDPKKYDWPVALNINSTDGVIKGWAKTTTETDETVVIVVYDSEDRYGFEMITIPAIGKGSLTGIPHLSRSELKRGSLLSDIALSGTAINEAGEQISGTFAWKNDNQSFSENGEQTVTWIFTPQDANNYEVFEGSSAISVVDELTNVTISNLNYLAKIDGFEHEVKGNVITITKASSACKVGYLKDGKYETITANESTKTYTVPAGVKDVVIALSGDADGDGVITMDDAIEILNKVLGASSTVNTDLIAELVADVDSDGAITMDDAIEILNKVLGAASSLN